MGFSDPSIYYWDTGATMIDLGMHKLPLGGGAAELVEVTYPNEGGYTPGDTYELYVGKYDRVAQEPRTQSNRIEPANRDTLFTGGNDLETDRTPAPQ